MELPEKGSKTTRINTIAFAVVVSVMAKELGFV